MSKRLSYSGLVIALLVGLGTSTVRAGELTYRPINPRFGGSPGNAAMLLDRANAQSKFTDPSLEETNSTLENFKQNLDRQVLSIVARRLIDETFGADGLESGGTFTTAVTQGGSAMLIKALIESGWFIPLEREGFDHLLTERKVYRVSREGMGDDAPPEIAPLMTAQIVIEGAITSYESNVVTGGLGGGFAGYFGSTDYQVDQVTVHVREVDVRSGRILHTVSTTKTILSRKIDIGVFRFIRFKELLELEAGLSTNEPGQMCVQEAIEKAVTTLVIEGVIAGSWKLADDRDIRHDVFSNYLRERRYLLDGRLGILAPLLGSDVDREIEGFGSAIVITETIAFLSKHKDGGKPMFAVAWFPFLHDPQAELPANREQYAGMTEVRTSEKMWSWTKPLIGSYQCRDRSGLAQRG